MAGAVGGKRRLHAIRRRRAGRETASARKTEAERSLGAGGSSRGVERSGSPHSAKAMEAASCHPVAGFMWVPRIRRKCKSERRSVVRLHCCVLLSWEQLMYLSEPECPKIFDIAGHYAGSGSANDLPRFRVLCKANVAPMEAALGIANVNPYKILFVDSVHNIQEGMGLASIECW